MKLKTLALTTALGASLGLGAAIEAAKAQDSLYVPLLTYRTGAFAGSGIQIANGMHDYLEMLNQRDGGIGGVKIAIEECETGYDTKKGVECYEATKSKGPLVHNPYSTGITLQLIPKAQVDKVPVLSMAYGLSAAADGSKFPWVFNPPVTYWDGASAIIKYIAEKEGGLDKLKGKKIGFIFLDAGYGREPIPLLTQFATQYGFELVQYPVPAAEMQNQSSQWLNVRRDRPDYMIMWGWGAMNPTAVKEAAKVRYPMDKFIGIWWSGGEDDARPAGEDAIGYRTLNFNGVGASFPVIADIKKHVIAKSLTQTKPETVGENLYNRGVLNSVLIAEAIATAQKLTGKKVVNAEDVRLGFENINLDAARIKALGLDGFTNPIKLSCDDHSGGHEVYMQKWDGKTWVMDGKWYAPMKDVVRPMLTAAAADYATKNNVPARTEACK
ncbi:MAG: ABC transporter substrate-binding protein [Hyphomicrobiaceae bacterium]|nr:ABC transporter substrate-binding protein [Hyphomicrobiaceae bacterium]